MAYSEDHIALAAEYALGTLDADERDQARERAEESAREQADMDSIGLMRARLGAIA